MRATESERFLIYQDPPRALSSDTELINRIFYAETLSKNSRKTSWRERGFCCVLISLRTRRLVANSCVLSVPLGSTTSTQISRFGRSSSDGTSGTFDASGPLDNRGLNMLLFILMIKDVM